MSGRLQRTAGICRVAGVSTLEYRMEVTVAYSLPSTVGFCATSRISRGVPTASGRFSPVSSPETNHMGKDVEVPVPQSALHAP